MHRAEHPSLESEFLSSHYYRPCTIPSPQIVEQLPFIHGWFHPSHKQLYEQASILHVDEHPSCEFTLISSHCSCPCFIPSPHKVEQAPLFHGWTQPAQEQF
jgi:hypothetical protein